MQPESGPESQPGPASSIGSPIGRARRPRLSDEETERRMLSTAAEAVAQTGLTVSLDHIRLEDVIREAGVARSAVYRRWPHKDAFLGDLLLELARAQQPLASTGGTEATRTLRRILDGRFDDLGTPDGRMRVLTEIVRQTAEQDFRHISGSRQWQTYLVLTVTFAGLPGGELREQIGAALAASERTFTERIAQSHRAVAELLGMRLRRPEVGFEQLAHLANALMRGLMVKAHAIPEVADQQITTEVGGVDGDWSLPALGLAGLILTHLEPDPDLDWDSDRTQRLRAVLDGDDDLFA